jgi:hypothetical protein
VTAESRDIARQLVACSMFRWMPGMLSDTSGRVLDTSEFRPDRNGPTFPLVTWSDHVTWRSCGESYDYHPTVPPGYALPDIDDPATGGAILVALGHEAARVRYSPSRRQQDAGRPWEADLYGGSVNSSITMHATLGRACAAVMIELSSRQPRQAE